MGKGEVIIPTLTKLFPMWEVFALDLEGLSSGVIVGWKEMMVLTNSFVFKSI
jgi:hypothetical protein